MMYVNQIIMLYTLNLYITVCQSYLSKTGRKKKEYLPFFACLFDYLPFLEHLLHARYWVKHFA